MDDEQRRRCSPKVQTWCKARYRLGIRGNGLKKNMNRLSGQFVGRPRVEMATPKSQASPRGTDNLLCNITCNVVLVRLTRNFMFQWRALYSEHTYVVPYQVGFYTLQAHPYCQVTVGKKHNFVEKFMMNTFMENCRTLNFLNNCDLANLLHQMTLLVCNRKK